MHKVTYVANNYGLFGLAVLCGIVYIDGYVYRLHAQQK